MELSIGQARKKNLQGSRLPRISKTSESILRYLANTRVSGNEVMDSHDGQLSTRIYRWYRIIKVMST
jgi:hypothetical protein